MDWRKERDSNPRYAKKRIPDFESGAFDHSAIFPGVEMVILTEPACPLTLQASSGFEHFDPAHIRFEHIRNTNAAIRLLVVFQHSHQGAPHGQA
jgi:hypothetical protein